MRKANTIVCPVLISLVAALSWQTAAAAKSESSGISLPGYEGVPFYYGGINRMLLHASINGHPATFMVDTGAGVSVLDGRRARAFGVNLTDAKSEYGQYTSLNGTPYHVGYINSFRAAGMDFGAGPVALLDRAIDPGVDGILGADILTHYNAVINCRTRVIFFKTKSSSHLNIAKFALSQHFTKVPFREEISHGFTVPCSINGHPLRMLVDTGAPLTTLNEATARLFGLGYSATNAAISFSDGASRDVGLTSYKQFTIGSYQVPPQKLPVIVLPNFAAEHGGVHIDGILGMELLAFNHGIIDFETKCLFLK